MAKKNKLKKTILLILMKENNNLITGNKPYKNIWFNPTTCLFEFGGIIIPHKIVRDLVKVKALFCVGYLENEGIMMLKYSPNDSKN